MILTILFEIAHQPLIFTYKNTAKTDVCVHNFTVVPQINTKFCKVEVHDTHNHYINFCDSCFENGRMAAILLAEKLAKSILFVLPRGLKEV